MSRLILILIAAVFLFGCKNKEEQNNKVEVSLQEPGEEVSQDLMQPGQIAKVSVTRLNLSPAQVVVLIGPVNEGSVSRTMGALDAVRKSGFDRALLVIDSPGGSVIDGAELIAYIKASPIQVDTYCKTMCASMGAHILQAGKTRYMSKNALIMFHPARGGMQGTLEEMSSLLRTISRYVDRLDREAVARSKLSYERFKKLSRDELWLDGPDAIKVGLVDELAFIYVQGITLFDLLKKNQPSEPTENGRTNIIRSFN